MPTVTLVQVVGAAMVVAAVLLAFLPDLAAWLRRRKAAAPTEWDYDMQDVAALRRLEVRGQRLDCAKYSQGLQLIRQNFFADGTDE